MKRNTLRFFAQLTSVSVLALVGLLALCGEPADDANFLLVVIAQLAVFATCWIVAWRLCVRWNISRKMRLLESITNY